MSRPSSPCHTRIWANEGPAASSKGGPSRLLSQSEVGRAQGNAAEGRRVADAEAAGDQQPGRQARGASAAYLAALDRIQDGGLDANISVKLTALGLDLGRDLAAEEAAKVAARGKEVGAMVGVDMESAAYVDRTLDLVASLEESYDDVGVCLQAYLHRTPADLERLNGL